MKKPIIGIVAKNFSHDSGKRIWRKQRVNSELRLGILNNGGIAIGILPSNRTLHFEGSDEGNIEVILSKEEQQDLIAQISLCDGIALQGGAYSDPYEEFVAKYCFDNDIPTLGICAGYNNMIRGLGGKTRQNGDLEVHNRSELKYAHGLKVDEGSMFFSIVSKTQFQVNSIHHYIADELCNLTAVGWADDGLIEVVENKAKKFYLGVKFHPEYLCQQDETHNMIIKAFVNACKK